MWLKKACEWLQRRRCRALLVAIGLLLASPSLFIGLQTDDLMLRAASLRLPPARGVTVNPWEPFTFLNGDPARNRALIELGAVPWWTLPHCRAAFWRPLTAATHLFDFRVLGAWPALMHAHSLLWFAALLWVAATLYRHLLSGVHPAWAAALAGLLFTFDNGHAWPAAWLANRNALIAGVFGFLALIAHDCWRREAWRPGALLAPLALAAALLGKEEAVAVGAYLLAYAAFLDPAPWRRRLAALAPCALVGIAWYAAYRAMGFGVVGSAMYVDPAHAPARFATRIARNAPVLLTAQLGFPEADLSSMLSASAFRVLWLWAVAFLALLGVAVAPLVRRDRVARFWAAGTLLSLVPVCATFPMNRLLMFPGLGAAGLLGQWLGGLRAGAEWLPHARAWRGLARTLGILLVFLHLVLAPVLFPARTLGIWAVGRVADRHYASLDPGPEPSRQTLVLVNPVASSHMLWIATRLTKRLPVPRGILALGPSSAPVTLTRPDAATLVVRPAAGYLLPHGQSPRPGEPARLFSIAHMIRFFDILFRGPDFPMRLGERIELSVATIEITAMTPDGRPAEATFRFRAPLEDPSLRWLQCTRGSFGPFTPPPVGQTAHLPSPLD